jgi:NNP family nitrate/nitrite transporter-like MFS transporter
LILLVGSLFLTFSTGIFPAIIGLICMSIGMGVNNAGVFKLVPTYINKAVGGGAGWVGGLGAFGGFVIPPILGYFVDLQGKAGYANGFSIFILLSIVSLGCIGLLKRGAN